MHTPTQIEICIASVEDAVVAQEGGADRVELNAALELGGLTPTLGLMLETRRAIKLPIIAMIRPRAGRFCYSDLEFRVMSSDIELMLESGADGIAFGVLHDDGRIDSARCQQLMRLITSHAPERWQGAVFHRAFDFTPDPVDALEILIDLGFRRVMTSGQRPTALEGSALIRRLIEHAGGRIEILPAAGIRPENVRSLLSLTSCDQVHASLRAPLTAPGSSGSFVKLGRLDDVRSGTEAASLPLVRNFVAAARSGATSA